MIRAVARKQDFGRKRLFANSARAAVSLPIVIGLVSQAFSQTQSQTGVGVPPAFEVASVKPNKSGSGSSSQQDRDGRLIATNFSL